MDICMHLADSLCLQYKLTSIVKQLYSNKDVKKKLKIELPNDPGILLLDIYLKEMKSLSQRDICT